MRLLKMTSSGTLHLSVSNRTVQCFPIATTLAPGDVHVHLCVRFVQQLSQLAVTHKYDQNNENGLCDAVDQQNFFCNNPRASCTCMSENCATTAMSSRLVCFNIHCALELYMWQSRVENKHYSVAYFDRIRVFKALYP